MTFLSFVLNETSHISCPWVDASKPPAIIAELDDTSGLLTTGIADQFRAHAGSQKLRRDLEGITDPPVVSVSSRDESLCPENLA